MFVEPQVHSHYSCTHEIVALFTLNLSIFVMLAFFRTWGTKGELCAERSHVLILDYEDLRAEQLDLFSPNAPDPVFNPACSLGRRCEPPSVRTLTVIKRILEGSQEVVNLVAITLPTSTAGHVSVWRLALAHTRGPDSRTFALLNNIAVEADWDVYKTENKELLSRAQDSTEPGDPVPFFNCAPEGLKIVVSMQNKCSNGGARDGNSVMQQWLGCLALARARSTQCLVDFICRTDGDPSLERFQGHDLLPELEEMRWVAASGSFWAWYPSPDPPCLLSWLQYLQGKESLRDSECEALAVMWPTLEGFYRFSFTSPSGKKRKADRSACPSGPVRVLFEDPDNMEADAYVTSTERVARLMMAIRVCFAGIPKPDNPLETSPLFQNWQTGGITELIQLFTIPDLPATTVREFGTCHTRNEYSPLKSSDASVRRNFTLNKRPTILHGKIHRFSLAKYHSMARLTLGNRARLLPGGSSATEDVSNAPPGDSEALPGDGDNLVMNSPASTNSSPKNPSPKNPSSTDSIDQELLGAGLILGRSVRARQEEPDAALRNPLGSPLYLHNKALGHADLFDSIGH